MYFMVDCQWRLPLHIKPVADTSVADSFSRILMAVPPLLSIPE
jgi:hypothetical protein